MKKARSKACGNALLSFIQAHANRNTNVAVVGYVCECIIVATKKPLFDGHVTGKLQKAVEATNLSCSTGIQNRLPKN